ncbi:MAG TPA: bifunctional hydroxymethylpyrimidine kinase/phosphomethylpyrimidine kinase [Acidobacteriaceae bacterium]|nr:bifunctional hydroxymethylpyrimidine kinase/phosphomethylpyrimidine kinase [Acidobacteriaceae bacterium]
MVGKSSISGAGKPIIALAIAGFDPSSGAGVTADLKVFAAHGVYGVSAITALTIQSTQGVRGVEAVSPEVLAETLSCLAEDFEISGVKIGMLATRENVDRVSGFLCAAGILKSYVVLDPILKASSGQALLSPGGVVRLKESLLPQVGWLTPNTEELAELARVPVRNRTEVETAAERLASGYPRLNLVVTGGHLDAPDDYLRLAGGESRWLPGRRIETTATHGTGCAFSSALLARLLLGDGPAEAVAGAKAYVAGAMAAADPVGKGKGPLNHLYMLGRTM